MLVVAALIYTMADSVNLLLGTLFVVAILTGTVTAFFRPAIAAAIPDLVPKDRVVTANSLGQLSLQLSVFFGQGLGGTLFRLLGAPFLFLINGISFLYASLSESLIKMPEIAPKEELSVKEHWQAFVVDLKEGFRYAWNRPGLRELVFISAVINFFTIPAIVLLPFFVEDTLGVRVDWYGFILVSFGLGGLLGYLFAGIVRLPGRSRMYLMLTFMIGQSVLYGVLGFMPRPIFVVILAIVAGFMGGYITVNITTVLQLSTPSEIPGELLFAAQLQEWRGRFDFEVLITVDHGDAAWRGPVGVVTSLIGRASFDPETAVAFVCGPEIMMRFTIQELERTGIAEERLFVSMERNMKCGIGLCGHCQLGPFFVCKDGPVLSCAEMTGVCWTREV